MLHKLVVRLLDADGALLTWAEVQAEARGDGCLWPSTRVVACHPCERSGIPTMLSVHWAEVNVETRVPITLPAVRAGDATVNLTLGDTPIVRVGAAASGLPPVTVHRAVAVLVPAGCLGVVGVR